MTDDINPNAEQYAEYRHGVRELCAQFDSKYWQSYLIGLEYYLQLIFIRG